jgi:hypothetical protein
MWIFPCQIFDGKTIHHLLLEIKCCKCPLKKALVGVDPVDCGQAGLALTFLSSYKDSCLIAQYLKAYLLNLFPEVQKYLPQDVINQAIQ